MKLKKEELIKIIENIPCDTVTSVEIQFEKDRYGYQQGESFTFEMS